MGKVNQFTVGEDFAYKEENYNILSKKYIADSKPHYLYEISCKTCKDTYGKLFDTYPLKLKWDYNGRLAFKRGVKALCPCNKGFKWEEEPLRELVNSKLRKGVTIENISNFKGINTKVTVNCEKHGVKRSAYLSIINGGGCKSCSVVKSKGPLMEASRVAFEEKFKEVLVDYSGWEGTAKDYTIICNCGNNYTSSGYSLMKGSVCRSCANKGVKSTTKSRIGSVVRGYKILGIDSTSNARDTKYILSCPICSEDGELWPEGSIKSNWGNISAGQNPCGCGYHSYSKEQRSILISRLISKAKYTLLDIEQTPSFEDTKIHSLCSRGHKYTSSYYNFKKGHRCKRCHLLYDSFFGLYQNRVYASDKLYVIFLEDFVKVGRSFDLPSRIRDYKRVFESVTLIKTVEDNHLNIYNLEQSLLQELSEFKYNPDKEFGGYTECLTKESLPHILSILARR